MMDFEQFQPFWSTTRRLAVFVLSLWGIIAVCALCFSGLLNETYLFGFPVGVLILGQIVAVIGVGLMFWFANAQDHVDQHFGASEDL